jgi:hypothetical protein
MFVTLQRRYSPLPEIAASCPVKAVLPLPALNRLYRTIDQYAAIHDIA